jgi:Tol biopolymer transport system component
VSDVQELRPGYEGAGTVGQVRLSPDATRMAFTLTDSPDAGLYVGDVGGQDWLKLVGFEGWASPRIGWSSDGQYIAYRLEYVPRGPEDEVAWVRTDDYGEVDRVDGQAFAWAANGPVLYVLDGPKLAVMRHNVGKGESRAIGEFVHHHGADFPPRLVASPDGGRLAYTTRDVIEDTARVFVIQRKDGEVKSELLTRIPGHEVHIFPFWSPKGVSLGLYMVHVAKVRTGMVLLKGLQGEGQIVYMSDSVEGTALPVWAPDGKSIVFPQQQHMAQLALADGAIGTVCEAQGEPRFLPDGRLIVEGGAAAHIIG